MSFGIPVRNGLSVGVGTLASLISSSGIGGIRRPTMSLNFLSGSLDSRITFTRSSSATRVNASGVIESVTANTPRFDYDPVTLAPRGLLVEEQRTNLLLRSEEFDNASWGTAQAIITANATTSPDGTADADSIIETTASSAHGVNQTATLSAVAYTYSAFVKANGRSWVRLFAFQSGPGSTSVWFNVSTGVVGTVGAGASNATITNFGNGWYRCAFTFTAVAASASLYVQLATADNGASIYTGDGTSGIFVYGAQLEAGAFATSYIPTVASQVTRTADVATITGANFSQWFNAAEGCFVAEADTFDTAFPVAVAATGSGAGYTTLQLLTTSAPTNSVRFEVGNTTQQADIAASVTSRLGPNKWAGAYAANNFAVSANGGAAVTDTSGTVPTVSELRLGRGYNPSSVLNGHIRSIRYWPTRLPNAQLQALTS